VGFAREVCVTFAWLLGNPEAWVAVAIAGIVLSGCASFEAPLDLQGSALHSASMRSAICAAGADTAECR
jgi:hypothetical protein